MVTSLITYADALLFAALMRAIQNATVSIEIMTFLFRTSYIGRRGREGDRVTPTRRGDGVRQAAEF